MIGVAPLGGAPPASTRGAIAGVDVGGTFTDLFMFDAASGMARVSKVATTRGHDADGVAAAVAALMPLHRVGAVLHATTVGTNAVLERSCARAGLITAAGFRDLLENGTPDTAGDAAPARGFVPVIDRDLRVEVPERTLADGTVLVAVDPAELRAAARRLIAAGAAAVCIAFPNSHANPGNERAALDAVREVWPNAHVAISSDILPEMRAFEQVSTTALNAVLQPVVSAYFAQLDQRLRTEGFTGEFLVLQSNGGAMSLETAARLPVRTARSGPVAGVMAAAHIAHQAGLGDVITGDLGGARFDVALVEGGVPATAEQLALGAGLVVRTPMIEITSIGVGGGAVARVDLAGVLQVGPEGAGTNPGPACYGVGGASPTVTDAHVVLGRIDAARPIGGGLARLDAQAAAAAILRDVGVPLGLDVMAAAEAILRVANGRMADALRVAATARGHDPRRLTLMAFGGAGGLHAGAMLAEVGLARALVPRFPGVTSALGCAIADMRHDRVRTLDTPLARLDARVLRLEMDATVAQLSATLDRAGVAFTARRVEHALDMTYMGETDTVAVALPLAPDGSGAVSADALARTFADAWRARFGYPRPGLPVRVLNLRSAVIGARPKIDMLALAPAPDATVAAACQGTRPAWFGGWRDTAVFERLALPVGAAIAGPAVLEQPDATTVVEPGQTGHVDRFGNVVMLAA